MSVLPRRPLIRADISDAINWFVALIAMPLLTEFVFKRGRFLLQTWRS
jgi:hypothetical protein